MSQIISKAYFDFLCNSNLKLGFFGGSFNPFHDGHASLASNIIKELDLDRLIILVAHYSSYKIYNTSAKIRGEYIKDKFYHPKVCISSIEEEMGYNYSALITKYIVNRSYEPCYMILGSDSLISFHHWEFYRYIISLMKISIVARETYTYQSFESKLVNEVFDFFRFKYVNISSTEIRKNISNLELK